MATRTLIDLQGDVFSSESWARNDPEAHLRRSRGFVRQGDTIYVSTGAGLNGAKAAVLGIALEAACAAGVVGLWLLWRFIH